MRYNTRILERTIDKCDLETINDPNDSQYFWINRRDLEIETKRNWQVILDIKDLVNNIKDNAISEIDAKKRLNILNMIKKCRNKT